jgi:hypothetical protein
MKIIIDEIKYYGCRQGTKIIFKHNNIRRKFPVKHGHFYTGNDTKSHIKKAIEELEIHAVDTCYNGTYSDLYIEYLLNPACADMGV